MAQMTINATVTSVVPSQDQSFLYIHALDEDITAKQTPDIMTILEKKKGQVTQPQGAPSCTYQTKIGTFTILTQDTTLGHKIVMHDKINAIVNVAMIEKPGYVKNDRKWKTFEEAVFSLVEIIAVNGKPVNEESIPSQQTQAPKTETKEPAKAKA